MWSIPTSWVSGLNAQLVPAFKRQLLSNIYRNRDWSLRLAASQATTELIVFSKTQETLQVQPSIGFKFYYSVIHFEYSPRTLEFPNSKSSESLGYPSSAARFRRLSRHHRHHFSSQRRASPKSLSTRLAGNGMLHSENMRGSILYMVSNGFCFYAF